MTLEAIRYNKGVLDILDQLLLPDESKYIRISNTDDGWLVIKKMQVPNIHVLYRPMGHALIFSGA